MRYLPLLALVLTSCQFNYTLPPLDVDREASVNSTVAKLHFFEGKDGKKYVFDDETNEIVEFDTEEVERAQV